MTAAMELRSLNRDYCHGVISREAYRAARARILDAAALGAPEPDPGDSDVTRPRATATNTRPQAPLEDATALATSPAVPQKYSSVSRRWALILAVPLLVAAGMAVWLVNRESTQPTQALEPAPPPKATATGDIGPKAQPDRAKALARKFLFANDWSETSVRDFATAWRALTPDERAAAERSVWMPGLVETIRRYVEEERSLLAAAGAAPEVSPSLADVAGMFGIDIASLPSEPVRVASADAAQSTPELPEQRTRDGGATSIAPAGKPAGTPSAPSAAVAAALAALAEEPDSVSPRATPPPAAAAVPSPSLPTPAASEPRTLGATGVSTKPSTEAADVVPGLDPCPASLVRKKDRYCRDAVEGSRKGPPLVVIPAQRFRMGSDLSPEEGPPHDVTIPRPIAIGVYEVSVDEFRAFCEASGRSCSELQGRSGDLPVTMVNWRDAVAYADWLSAQTGQTYRLPSEAEWEFAARAGTQSRFPFGDEVTSAQAAFAGPRPRQGPAPRSERFNRNAFNLYHTVGNVREWVLDDWSPGYQGAPSDGSPRRGGGSEKVVRGGSYADGLDGIRSSSRQPLAASARDERTGFRVVREIR